jgi:hypothetical protein
MPQSRDAGQAEIQMIQEYPASCHLNARRACGIGIILKKNIAELRQRGADRTVDCHIPPVGCRSWRSGKADPLVISPHRIQSSPARHGQIHTR